MNSRLAEKRISFHFSETGKNPTDIYKMLQQVHEKETMRRIQVLCDLSDRQAVGTIYERTSHTTTAKSNSNRKVT
jgi:hypothetical protein